MPQSCLWSFSPTSYFSNVLCLCAGPIHVNDTMVSFLSIDASTLCILFLSALFESVYFIFLDLKVATRTRSLRWCCSYASANKTWRDSCLHIKNTQTRKTHIHTIPLCLLHLVPSSKSKLRFRSSASTSSGPVRGFFLTFSLGSFVYTFTFPLVFSYSFLFRTFPTSPKTSALFRGWRHANPIKACIHPTLYRKSETVLFSFDIIIVVLTYIHVHLFLFPSLICPDVSLYYFNVTSVSFNLYIALYIKYVPSTEV